MSTSATLRLDGALTIVTSQLHRQRLLDAAHGAQDELLLDLSGVDAFDTAGVQLLLATRKTMAARAGRLGVPTASGVVIEVLAIFGLEALLRRPTSA